MDVLFAIQTRKPPPAEWIQKLFENLDCSYSAKMKNYNCSLFLVIESMNAYYGTIKDHIKIYASDFAWLSTFEAIFFFFLIFKKKKKKKKKGS